MMRRTGSIGVFDSGFGGLTILKEIVKKLPDYQYVYLGDTARTPYGTRSQEVIYEFTRQAVDFLFRQGSEIIILACNSASSEALRKIQREYIPKKYPGKKVLGVLIPGAEAAVQKTKNKKIGVIATEGTVHSNAFAKEIYKLNPEIKVFQKAAPLLVPIVEAGEQKLPATKMVIKQYVKSLKEKGIDTLILGCTHYGILEKALQQEMGPEVHVLSEGKVVARKLKDYLERHPEIENKLKKNPQTRFFSTDVTEKFTTLGSKFFGKTIKAARARLA